MKSGQRLIVSFSTQHLGSTDGGRGAAARKDGSGATGRRSGMTRVGRSWAGEVGSSASNRETTRAERRSGPK
jgi:hypothetical protein